MSDLVQIQWTAGSIDLARKVARYLVQERHVASAKITPWVESIYMLNNQLETAQETQITFLTQKCHVDFVKKIILENCSYQVPEILELPILKANQEYIEWLGAQLAKEICQRP